MLTDPVALFPVIDALDLNADLFSFRFGVGWGEIATAFSDRSWEMDGACFHAARRALDLGKKEKRWVTVQGLGDDGDGTTNAVFRLMQVVREGWTKKQRLAVKTRKTNVTQAVTAEEMGLDTSTLSKMLKAARYKELIEMEGALGGLLDLCLARSTGRPNVNPAVSVLLLLLAGHLIGDFVLQTRRTAESKTRFAYLARHGGELLLAHGLVLWPFWSPRLLVVVVGLVVLHLVVDSWKARRAATLTALVVDQALHLVLILVAWAIVLPIGFTALGVRWAEVAASGWYVWLALFVGLVGFNLRGGSVVVRLALGPDLVNAAAGRDAPRGAIVGYLERSLVLVLALLGQWASIGLILAAKSLARFKDLDKRDFAEYYLIGTLTSVLVAVLVSIAAILALDLCGVALP